VYCVLYVHVYCVLCTVVYSTQRFTREFARAFLVGVLVGDKIYNKYQHTVVSYFFRDMTNMCGGPVVSRGVLSGFVDIVARPDSEGSERLWFWNYLTIP
jgi:hypothetical protein